MIVSVIRPDGVGTAPMPASVNVTLCAMVNIVMILMTRQSDDPKLGTGFQPGSHSSTDGNNSARMNSMWSGPVRM